MSEARKAIGRREFFQRSVAATGSMLLVNSKTAFGYQANSTVNIGLLGCGGRGTGVASDFVNHTNSQVTALGDILRDRIDAARTHFDTLQAEKGRSKVSQIFKGSNSHQEIAESDVDMILIATPPYYHPLHLKTVIDQGKHIYLEKPVATDVKGCMDVAALAPKVEGKMSVDVGFQIRYGSQFVEQTKRIRNGAIGDVALADGFYFASDLPRKGGPGMSAAEAKLRNWYFYKELAGDIIVEQNIHVVDVYNWMLDAHPIRAQATAARKVRNDIGDVSDHYVITFYYPNDVRASFVSTQFLPEWGTVGWRLFGAKGFSEAFYTGGLKIVGENPWAAGDQGMQADQAMEVDPLGDATPLKAQAFINSVVSGNYHNQLKQGAESTLSAILAREAAYEGRELTWGELLASNQSWEADLDLSQIG